MEVIYNARHYYKHRYADTGVQDKHWYGDKAAEICQDDVGWLREITHGVL